MRRVFALVLLICASATPAVAQKRVHGARIPAPWRAPAPPPAPRPEPLLTSPGPRLALTGLPALADRRAVCRTACARHRFQTDAVEEDGGVGWGRCTAACNGVPVR